MFPFKYLVSSILIIIIDSFYLNLFKPFFSSQIKKIQQSPMQLNIPGVLLTYLFIIIGFNYFVIGQQMSSQDAFLFGLVIYGIYEATNWAIFTNWSLFSVIIDTLWGGILFFLTTWIMRLFIKK